MLSCTMGRTSRKRYQKKKYNMQKLNSQDDNDTLTILKSWLLQHRLSTSNLIPTNFAFTGRGLKTLKDLKEKEVLIRLPIKLLITTSTISQSGIQILFLNNYNYTAQCALSVFLIYEAHLQEASEWYPYIISLPQVFTTPEFCRNAEKKLLPIFIQNYMYHTHKLTEDFALLIQSIKLLNNVGKDFCPHCKISFSKIITFNKYQWAYYVVNTRSVYINTKENLNHTINIKTPNNLALAPFLDLFNHDLSAVVEASIVVDKHQNKFYQIITLNSFKKDSQVFINYGSHNNTKLFVDYGFFIPNNHLDEISFNLSDVEYCTVTSQNALQFIISNKFDKDMGFNKDGLNYNAIITLFILINKLEKEQWNMRVYGTSFNSEELFKIYNLGIQILYIKKDELIKSLINMKNLKNCSPSFSVAINLVEEYIRILDKSLLSLKTVIEEIENN